MATIEAAAPPRYVRAPRRGPITRLLEDERRLALFPMLPTMVLLGTVHRLSLCQGRRAVGHRHQGRRARPFCRHRQFHQDLARRIFRVAVWNTCLYTFVTTVFKLALGLWLALLLNRHFKRQGVHARLHPAAVHHPDGAVDLCLEVDVRSDLQRPQLDAVPRSASSTTRINWLGDPVLAMISVICQCLARRAVLRDQPPGRPADDQPRAERGGRDRRRPRRRVSARHGRCCCRDMVVMLFSVIQTFADFQLVYVLTGGGPHNTTHCWRPTRISWAWHRAASARARPSRCPFSRSCCWWSSYSLSTSAGRRPFRQ